MINHVKQGHDPTTKNTAFSGVVVTGNEFDTYSDIKELRKKAKNHYKTHLQGKTVKNEKLGKIDFDNIDTVLFTKSGLYKFISTSAKVNKLLMVKYLPRIIETATDIRHEESKGSKHGEDSFYYLTNYVQVGEKNIPVEITLIKVNDGSIHYKNHILPTEEKKKDTSVYAEPVSSNEALGTPPYSVSSVTQSIADTDANYNLNILNAMGIIDKAGDSKESIKLTGTLNAILFARHADIFAQKVRDITGKKYTALDYLNDVVIRFGGNVDSVGVNQAAMYKSREGSFSDFVEKAIANDPDTIKSYFTIGEGENSIDVPAETIRHIQNGEHMHPLTLEQYKELEQGIFHNIKAVGISKRQRSVDRLDIVLQVGLPKGDLALVLHIYPKGRVVLGTAMPKSEITAEKWIKERSSHALHGLDRGVASNSFNISNIKQHSEVVKRLDEIRSRNNTLNQKA